MPPSIPIYAAPIATLTIETHDGATWLCAVEHGTTRPLARFADDASADVYRRATNLRDRHMHAMGQSGI